MDLCAIIAAHFMTLAACGPAPNPHPQPGGVSCPVERRVYKCVRPDGSYYRDER